MLKHSISFLRKQNKLQRIQTMAARLISLTRKFDHITPILRDNLHWLPVDQRIHFKILLLTYKAFHGIAPSYLSELISVLLHPALVYGQATFVLKISCKLSVLVQKPTANEPLLLLPLYYGMRSRTTSANHPMLLNSSLI